MDTQVQEIYVEDIIPNRFQPRLTFDEKALQELSDSIKVHGVIQPLVLRKIGNKYEIIAGERRYKASCMAGLKKVPAIVREMTDNESAEVALIENVQRKNLSSIEEAQSYKNLLNRNYITQEELAGKLGVAQSTIANKLRLLNLCDEVQNALLNEQISERHARSLLQLENPDDQKAMLNRIIKERLTVKQLDIEIKKKITNSTEDDTSNNNSQTGSGGMKPMDNNINGPIETNKNIFGFPIDAPVDLEQSAANLMTGVEEKNTPIDFNPFGNNIPNLGPTSTIAPKEETIETFDMFGDAIKPVETASPTPESIIPQPSIGDQINSVRNTVRNVEQSGFKVEMEEYDFEDMYQIVVKIKKDKR